jgi:uncharacterized protein (DUF2147 family)
MEFNRIKKTMAIVLIVLFVAIPIAITAIAAADANTDVGSTSAGLYDGNIAKSKCQQQYTHGYTDGYKAGRTHCNQIYSFKDKGSTCYDRGYYAGFDDGFYQGQKFCKQ